METQDHYLGAGQVYAISGIRNHGLGLASMLARGAVRRRDPQEALDRLGIPGYRKGQGEAVAAILDSRSVLAIMPTGAGKSLVYQVGGYALGGITLIISPLIALMGDQERRLRECGFHALALNSSLKPHEALDMLTQLLKVEEPVYLFVSPERLQNGNFVEQMKAIKERITLLAIDEAHCLSQWGHDFRPDYMRIAKFRDEIDSPVTLAMTATATERVAGEIEEFLQIPGSLRIVTGFDRPNIELRISERRDTARSDFEGRLNMFLRYVEEWEEAGNHEPGADMIYMPTVKNVEEAFDYFLQHPKIQQRYRGNLFKYHGQMRPEDRRSIEHLFIATSPCLIVCTLAFGMGIDKPNVRTVGHIQIPGSLENYYQEIGRAGRDGKPSLALLFWNTADDGLHRFFNKLSFWEMSEYHALYQTLLRGGNVGQDDRSGIEHMERAGLLKKVKIVTRPGKYRYEVCAEWGSPPAPAYDEEGELIEIDPTTSTTPEYMRLYARQQKIKQIKETLLNSILNYAGRQREGLCLREAILQHFEHGIPADRVQPEFCCSVCNPE